MTNELDLLNQALAAGADMDEFRRTLEELERSRARRELLARCPPPPPSPEIIRKVAAIVRLHAEDQERRRELPE
jgi:hypothetical protein